MDGGEEEICSGRGVRLCDCKLMSDLVAENLETGDSIDVDTALYSSRIQQQTSHSLIPSAVIMIFPTSHKTSGFTRVPSTLPASGSWAAKRHSKSDVPAARSDMERSGLTSADGWDPMSHPLRIAVIIRSSMEKGLPS